MNKKFILTLLCITLCVGFVFAGTDASTEATTGSAASDSLGFGSDSTTSASDSFGFGSDSSSASSDSFGFASDDSSASFGSGFGDSSFSADTSSSSTPALVFSGSADVAGRLYVGSGAEAKDSPVSCVPELKLNMDYSTDKVEFQAKLKLNQTILQNYPEDVIDELIIRGFLGDFVVEAGKMKVVWGKGDKIHVLDNFNANDYLDFIYPDYIDRRLAMPMVKVAYTGMLSARFEAVYTPFMTPDRYATDGLWVPSDYTSMVNDVITPIVMHNAKLVGAAQGTLAQTALAQTAYLAQNSSASKYYPNTNKLKYGQFGLRATGTIGTFDWGASYFLGRMKQPSFDKSILVYNQKNSSATWEYPTLDYDLVQVFGLEGATVLGPFNTRFELAYNMTKDVAGDDGAVHNNSIAWVAGFDIDLPISNLNLNFQTTGSVFTGINKIKDNGALDIDYNDDGFYSNNKIILGITDSFMHENLKTELNLVWGIERGDFIMIPKVTYTLLEGLDCTLSGMYIYSGNSNGEFTSFEDNSFIQAKLVYAF